MKNSKTRKPIEQYIMILFIMIINIFVNLKKIYDTDYFWHLKVGEYIFNNKKIPISDIFSWYGISHHLDWFSHEWLSELLLYMNYRIFGHIGNILLPPIIISLIVLFIYLTNKNTFFKNIFITTIWVVIFIMTMTSLTVPRPQIFSYALLTVTMYILNKYRTKDTRLIWILPIISLLWVNMHGGSSSLLYVLIIITILTGLFNFKFMKIQSYKLEINKIKNLIITFFLSLCTGMINPKGYRILFYPIKNMDNKLMITSIQEWRCPDLKNPNDLKIFIAIFIVVIILILIKEQIDLYDIIIILAFTYLTLKSVRFIALFMIVTTPFVFKYTPKVNKDDIITLLKYPVILVTILLIVCCILNGKMLASNPINTAFLPSDKSVQVIKKEQPKRILNYYGWGGYLIFKEAPVFIDGRADMYSDNIYPDYIAINNIKNDIKELLNKYNFDMVYYPKDSMLNVYLSENKDYKLIFSDNISVVYKKIGFIKK